jgi:hypothetical protein
MPLFFFCMSCCAAWSGSVSAPNPVGVTPAIVATAAPIPAASNTPAKPVFDCYSSSMYRHTPSGKLVDVQGNIWSYHRGRQGKLVNPVIERGNVYYRQSELAERYAEHELAGSVDKQKLVGNLTLIAAAAEGHVSQHFRGNDAGTYSCHAYIHDESRQRYQDVELGTVGGGDFSVDNSAPAAKSLLEWLKTVSVSE